MTAATMLSSVLGRLSGGEKIKLPFLDALQSVSDIIATRLYELKSDLVKADLDEDVSHEGASVGKFTLDSGFLTFVGDPWVEGYTTTLTPVTDELIRIYEAETSSGTAEVIPQYYRLRGLTVTLYPTNTVDITVRGSYYFKPILDALTDDIPFSGMFDQLIVDAIVKIAQAGLGLSVDPGFRAYIREHVDSIVSGRPRKAIFFNMVV